MNVTIRHVIKPTDAELDDYARVAAAAFKYNYFGSGLNRDKTLQEPFLRAHFAGALVEEAGEIHIAESESDGVVGIAVWFRPGHSFLESDCQRNAGWNQVMAKLPAEFQKWWKLFLVQYNGLSERFLGPGVKLGSYHLQLLGVTPVHQGKGIGTSLMRFGEAKEKTAGKSNTDYYQSIGYTLGGTGPIKAAPPSNDTFDMGVFIKHTEDGAACTDT